MYISIDLRFNLRFEIWDFTIPQFSYWLKTQHVAALTNKAPNFSRNFKDCEKIYLATEVNYIVGNYVPFYTFL